MYTQRVPAAHPRLGVARCGPYVWWDGEQQRDMRARTEKRRRVRVLYT